MIEKYQTIVVLFFSTKNIRSVYIENWSTISQEVKSLSSPVVWATVEVSWF